MAEHLINQYGQGISVIQLIPSSGGVFEVSVSDELIFSKKETDRFPEPEEIESHINQ